MKLSVRLRGKHFARDKKARFFFVLGLAFKHQVTGRVFWPVNSDFCRQEQVLLLRVLLDVLWKRGFEHTLRGCSRAVVGRLERACLVCVHGCCVFAICDGSVLCSF